MGTITSVMDIARQALMANQEALNVTAANVANQNTPGYTREVVSFQAVDAVTLNGSSYGAGVSATEASQRSRVLDQQVQQQTQAQAQTGAVLSALQQVQNIFGLSSSVSSAASTALGTAVNSFFNSLSTLTSNPSDTATRQGVLAAARSLAGTFNSASSQMATISSNLDQQVASDVTQVNTLTTTIASLNGQIMSLSPSSDAGTLEDQRQQAITQLSQFVGLDQISTAHNGVSLTTTTGSVLVSGDQSFGMTSTNVGGTTHVLAGVGGTDVTSSLSGGDLGGVLEARDKQIPAYQSALDTLAYGIGTQVNTVNAGGLDGNGNPGTALFSFATGAVGAARSIQLTTGNPSAVAAAAVGEGSAGNSNAIKLASLATGAVAAGVSPASFLASFISQIGGDTSAAATSDGAQQTILANLTTQKNTSSGVSLDQEAANLTQYQRSYQAASQIFTIADQIMASAINLGISTAVS